MSISVQKKRRRPEMPDPSPYTLEQDGTIELELEYGYLDEYVQELEVQLNATENDLVEADWEDCPMSAQSDESHDQDSERVLLQAVTDFVQLRERYRKHPRCKTPAMKASLAVAARMGKGVYFAQQVRFNEKYLLQHHTLPPSKTTIRHGHVTLLDNEAVVLNVRKYLAAQNLGQITPQVLCRHVNDVLLPAMGLTGSISKQAKKGLYEDGHNRPDVLESRKKFLDNLLALSKMMNTYDEKTLDPILPTLERGQKEHIFVTHDESIFHTNDLRRRVWLETGQQPLRKKGNGRAIHVSDFLCEPTGRLKLSEAQIAEQLKLAPESRLAVTDARKIIFPGKNHDKWWDLPQLMTQLEKAVDIFEAMFPNAIGVWAFDCSSAHEAFAPDALNVNNMNVNPGGKQTLMHDTIIPLDNPPPKPGWPDTRGQRQSMVYAQSHSDRNLAGKAKGMAAVLRERTAVWDKLCEAQGGEKKVVGICKVCKLSQAHKDALRRVALAEQAGQEDMLSDSDLEQAMAQAPPEDLSEDKWCCMKKVLSNQTDFIEEKPMIQLYLERRGHICVFFPKFHCELNAIEMYWGFAKYRYREVSDGRFPTARTLVPQCLDICDTHTIRRFFRKCWRYMDAYRKGLDARETAFAVKKYKSHRSIGMVDEVREALRQHGVARNSQ
ncbi:hypothetical protein BD410DRAFT_817185 [Rickenella mellea]|uniref:Uncharacterized protein n=1 Tax=Rickenella mellea TaxID=50990 RepID=A0A4Y7PHS5_9AGAM|nr:hypothetical protein BD410DRAFT_817185 [Rickenella mellea]